jgi:hypothetical protein
MKVMVAKQSSNSPSTIFGRQELLKKLLKLEKIYQNKGKYLGIENIFMKLEHLFKNLNLFVSKINAF